MGYGKAAIDKVLSSYLKYASNAQALLAEAKRLAEEKERKAQEEAAASAQKTTTTPTPKR